MACENATPDSLLSVQALTPVESEMPLKQSARNHKLSELVTGTALDDRHELVLEDEAVLAALDVEVVVVLEDVLPDELPVPVDDVSSVPEEGSEA